MSKRELFGRRNDNIRKLNAVSRINRNVIAKSGESIEHFLKKAEIGFKLMDEGNDIVTEAIFQNGKRADIFVLDTGHVYEIVNTESESSIKKKMIDYPINPEKLITITMNDKYIEGRFIKGHKGHWKDKKLSKEHKQKISEGIKNNLPKTAFKKGMTGEKCVNWKGGRVKNSSGYIMIYSSKHPFCDSHKYVQEHRLVMERHLGRYLRKEEIVHHINEIRDDNRFENLFLFPNDSLHQCYHVIKRHNKKLTVQDFMKNNEIKI